MEMQYYKSILSMDNIAKLLHILLYWKAGFSDGIFACLLYTWLCKGFFQTLHPRSDGDDGISTVLLSPPSLSPCFKQVFQTLPSPTFSSCNSARSSQTSDCPLASIKSWNDRSKSRLSKCSDSDNVLSLQCQLPGCSAPHYSSTNYSNSWACLVYRLSCCYLSL